MEQFVSDSEVCLFQNVSYYQHFSTSPLFFLEKGELKLTTTIYNSQAQIGLYLPYGFFIEKENFNIDHFYGILIELILELKAKNVKKLTIKFPPDIIPDENFKNLILKIRGIVNVEWEKQVGQWLFLNTPLHYSQNINRNYNKIVKNKGFHLSKFDEFHLNERYSLIAQNRLFKNRPITIDKRRHDQLLLNFNNIYKPFDLFFNEKMVATATGVVLNKSLLYYFIPAQDASYNMYSPTTFLLLKMIEWAKNEGFQIFDLGVSSEGEVINKGLFEFKRKFGAVAYEKYTSIISF